MNRSPTDPAPSRGPRRRLPRVRWLVAVTLLAAFAAALMVHAYADARFAPDSEATVGAADTVPASVRQGGSIIDTRNGAQRSYRLPPKTIALTFDDGPDARWTPHVAQVLR